MTKQLTFLLSLTILTSCQKKEGTLFRNPDSEETGITFSNDLSPTEDLNILDYLYFYNGGGVAVGDINNDSLPDIFFSGNQVKNKLYLNKGDLKFEDITEKAGVAGSSDWNTGAIMGDVNGDGLLDIYVCAVVGLKGLDGHNELFINNGDGSFTESAAQYGLDFDSYSSNAAFLDFDLDGDLDIYLLNHAVHTQESFGKAELRLKRNFQTGDKLLRNDGSSFTDISEEAGIYGGVNGYGLGLAIADFNQDGWPDIYVGNDFHEDDYYYLNNGDGTFTESLKAYFGHTTRFSMGNDVSDINHDGWPDILSLDMLPEDEEVLKSSQGDFDIQILDLQTREYGYHYQFSRNMLHLNTIDGYSEIGLQSGIAATDWSWSSLFADFDQDGEQDIFISNGIPKRPNDMDYINYVSSEQIKNKINHTKLVDQEALALMPSGKTHNYAFRGSNDLSFIDESGNWMVKDTLVSGATALGDLDNDGDMDLVVNNINSKASIYLNKTDAKANYLKLGFQFSDQNKVGIGTKVFSYHKGHLQYKELYNIRGFQSSSEPIIHFGYDKLEKVDSLRIVWPNNTYQTLTDVPVNQTLTIKPENPKPFDYTSLRPKSSHLFDKVNDNLGLDFVHIEDNYTDFNRQKLMPYQVSDRGPALAIGDLNGDDKTDFFFGGSKHIPARTFIQKDSLFSEIQIPSLRKDSINEDVAAVIEDFNSDGQNDLFIGTGGADFFYEAKPLLDRFYVGRDSAFIDVDLPRYFENASVVRPEDYDNDGDLDIFIGNQMITSDFGKNPTSYLLRNDKGNFTSIKSVDLASVGMVTDAVWNDFNGDGLKDLIIVGEWMSPTFFENTNGKLVKVNPLKKKINGLWQTIIPFDIDGDNDTDYLLGNWGTNSKFMASAEFPMKMYYSDFDSNGQTETIVVTQKNGKYYPLENFDELSSQLVSLKKKFTTYKGFAGKTVEEIFEGDVLKKARILEINTLSSGYLKNENGSFSFVPFEKELQVAPIMTFAKHDFDKNGKEEVLAAGNYFGVKPFHGRFGSFAGALIKNENDVILSSEIGLDLTHKSVRHLTVFSLNDQQYLLVTINNDKAEVYKITE